MTFLYILMVLNIKFASYQSLSNYLDYKYFYDGECHLNIPQDEPSVMFRLVEIFSPSAFINVRYSSQSVTSVLQASFIVPNRDGESIYIRSAKGDKFWYRIVNASDILPGYDSDGNIYLKATGSNSWYTTVDFYQAKMTSTIIYWVSYDIWIVPIFPGGIFNYWSFQNFPVTVDSIISAINKSIDNDYLVTNGINVGSKINTSNEPLLFQIPNRKTYTNLIIIRAKVNQKIQIQYPAITIYGCASDEVFSSTDNEYKTEVIKKPKTCTLVTNRSWYIVICCMIFFGGVFVIIGHLLEPLQFFVSAWIFSVYACSIIFNFTIKSIYDSGNYSYAIVFGVAFSIAFVLSIFTCCCCAKQSRFLISLNVLCIILIQWSIMWFALEYVLSSLMIIFISCAAISFIILIVLFVFNGFTSTFGSVFIGMSLCGCGFSLIVVNSSSIIYLFLDFFNFILTRSTKINYYSLFLYEDLIILVIWLLLTVIFGLLAFKLRKSRESKVKSEEPSPAIQMSVVPSSYGAMANNENTNPPMVNAQLVQSPPSYRQVPSAPRFQDLPPPYSG